MKKVRITNMSRKFVCCLFILKQMIFCLQIDEVWSKLYVRLDFRIQIKEIIMKLKCTEMYKFMPYLQE